MAIKPKVFIIFEGKETDPWFYDKILSTSVKATEFGYELQPIELIDLGEGTAGGKAKILELHRLMKARRTLSVESPRGKTSVMFFVDADHDRLANSLVRSKHLTYTKFADAEADLFATCDTVIMVQILTSTSVEDARRLVAALGDWRQMLADEWRDWFHACLTAFYVQVAGPRLGSSPPKAKRSLGKFEAEHVRTVFEKLEGKCQSPALWKHGHRKASLRLQAYYSQSRGVELLKGKWLAAVLKDRIDLYAEKNNIGRVRSDESVYVALRAAADFTGNWVQYYTSRVEALITA